MAPESGAFCHVGINYKEEEKMHVLDYLEKWNWCKKLTFPIFHGIALSQSTVTSTIGKTFCGVYLNFANVESICLIK